MYKILFTETYNKKASNFIKKHKSLLKQYEKTFKLLEINPFHPSLRLHKLEGKFQDIYSISINISYRIAIEFIIKEDIIIPLDVGTHDELYK
ncbi:MAG: type II toxin-antitoxin system RelE/ParE family toxin [Spirochaetes bacterium]|nr:type II toxin-antitoxin system RelE/ParE family toxin [Spirochaetota bacterium]